MEDEQGEGLFDKRIIIVGVILGLLMLVLLIVLRPDDKPPTAPQDVVVTQDGDTLSAEVQRLISEEEKLSLEQELKEEFGARQLEIEIARPYTQEGLEFVAPRISPEYIERELNPAPGDVPGSDVGADYEI